MRKRGLPVVFWIEVVQVQEQVQNEDGNEARKKKQQKQILSGQNGLKSNGWLVFVFPRFRLELAKADRNEETKQKTVKALQMLDCI
jgi:hypothetical protein